MSVMPFAPAGTVSISATTTSASTTLALTSGDVRVYNSTTVVAFIKFSGTASPTAATTDLPIAPGSVEIFNISNRQYVAAILASGTGTIYFTSGDGI